MARMGRRVDGPLEDLLIAWYEAAWGSESEFSGDLHQSRRALNAEWHERRRELGLPKRLCPLGRYGEWTPGQDHTIFRGAK
jgi:hypothetical protein